MTLAQLALLKKCMEEMDDAKLTYADILAWMLKESSTHELIRILNNVLWDLEIELRNELADAIRDCEKARFKYGK
jgi:hypothetical protein